MVTNWFSAEEHMCRNHKTRNYFCIEMSMDTWKSSSTQYVISRHERPLHPKC